MPSSSNKKLSILYTLKILKEYSDENHLLTQTQIANKINEMFGMECERKSIGYNIDSLIDFGYDIIKTKDGCYLGEREIEPSEIQFLVDAVFSSKSVDSKHSKELANKLSQFLSKHKRKQYNYIYKSDEITRTNNKELFYNIDIINEAIEKKKQIKFNYNRFYYNSSQKNEKTYIVNPYFLINSQGKYYLVCNYDHLDKVGNYKVDKICNIEILDTPAKPITKLLGYEKGIDKSKYANEHIYMFGGNTVRAKIKIYNESAVEYVDEWFGKNVRFYKKDNTFFVDLDANENALVYWCLQYGESVELLEPKETREKIKSIVKEINKRYN